MRTLAADEMQGRATGEPGALAAARYLASVLEGLGLEPAGDGGLGASAYLRTVPLERMVFDSTPRARVVTASGEARALEYGVDFAGLRGTPQAGPLEVVTVRSAEEVPREFAARTALFLDGNGRERSEWLALAGGAALVVQPGSRRAGQPGSLAGSGWLRLADGGVRQPSLTVRGPALEFLREAGGARIEVESGSRIEPVEAFNVAASIPGRGPLARETVVFTAHYDHIGTRAAAPGEGPDADLVFNGADDDASGCAVVLELARAFAAGPPPERTLLFLLVTGEELGLLGTNHYLDHPVAPLADTVCNLNFEMVGRPDALVGGPGRLWLTGDERSNLGAAWRAAGIDVDPDPRPDQRFFMRSDNYAFAVRGVVAQTLSSYDLHGDYHHVDDEADRIDFDHLEGAARLAYRAARTLADGTVDPAWMPDGRP